MVAGPLKKAACISFEIAFAIVVLPKLAYPDTITHNHITPKKESLSNKLSALHYLSAASANFDAIRARSRDKIGFKYCPVYEPSTSATSSGVPVATI